MKAIAPGERYKPLVTADGYAVYDRYTEQVITRTTRPQVAQRTAADLNAEECLMSSLATALKRVA